MRTSPSQFQLMVEFMERNGDLSKPADGPQGRATNMQRWTELTTLLNADATGDTKTCEKWRKVWSDFKNNTKKKAARLYRAARGTGGGPASNLKLSSLEERVLGIVGSQAATGLVQIPEIGVEEDQSNSSPPLSQIQRINEQRAGSTLESWSRPGSSTQPPVFPPVQIPNRREPSVEDLNQPALSGQTHASPPVQVGNSDEPPPQPPTPRASGPQLPFDPQAHGPQPPTSPRVRLDVVGEAVVASKARQPEGPVPRHSRN